ncbi:MAG: phenylalanine--tRNA ligase subunit alpha [Rhodothalassiaceae bacterium]
MRAEEIDALAAELTTAIEAADTLDALDEARVKALGKKGRVTELMKGLGRMDPDTRKRMGPLFNQLKNQVAERIETRRAHLEAEALAARLASEQIDMTLPVTLPPRGHIHPISQVMDELAEIFADLGFTVGEGPDVEDDFHNFTALNIPEHHPARAMHDTFYLPPSPDGTVRLLRTHTSNVQIRTMTTQQPPIRMIAPGRCYRSDWDATHTPMFHQFEGLVIDRDIHMGHLKGTLEAFVKAFFEVDHVETRFRASFFPFTEPSAELDVRCSFKDGVLKLGEGEDWLEILGCGMVHPRVLQACHLDPEEWQGFAWGCGIDRLAMLKYGIPDLRPFFESDKRWLSHYGFDPADQPSLAGGLSR